MDICPLNSNSSDSDLESKIKLTCLKERKECIRCFICQEGTKLIEPTESSRKKFIASVKMRFEAGKGRDKMSNMHDIFYKLNNVQQGANIQWHKKCYNSVTSSKNIAIYIKKCKKLFSSDTSANEKIPSDIRISRSVSVFDINLCFFCQKRSHKKKLCQVMTTNTEEKIKKIAQKHPTYLARIGENDLIAMEIKYHVNCLTLELQKFKKNKKPSATATTSGLKRKSTMEEGTFIQLTNELKKGLEKGKGYETTTVYGRFRELGGDSNITSRHVLKKVLNHFGDTVELVKSNKVNESRIIVPTVSKDEVIANYIEISEHQPRDSLVIGASEMATLHKICQEINIEINEIPSYKNLQNLNHQDYKQYIPEKLFLLVSLLVSNELINKETNIISICQDIIYASSNGKKHTPKHVGLGILVHQETKSKKIIETLNKCGHSITYKDTLRIRNTIAENHIQTYLENDHVIIPRQLQCNRFVQFAADNIDILEETLDKAPTFHGTQLAVFQRGPAKVEVTDNFKLLPYKTQLNIPEDFHHLDRIYFNKSRIQVPDYPNKQEIIAMDDDNSFIKKHNIAWLYCRLESSNSNDDIRIPQWTGFNRIFLKDNSNVTTYGYLPLFPYVASDYDTIWTVLQKFSTIAQKLHNKYTVVTFDQAIYFKAKELQWLKQDELKHVVIRLGGFHIMLNFLKVIGQHMENSGLCDVWLESGLYGQATIEGILKGNKWNKGIRAHKLTYESLMRILLFVFERWIVDGKSESVHSTNLLRLLARKISENVGTDIGSLQQNFKRMTDVSSTLFAEFREFIESQSPTFKYWYCYLYLVETLLEFNMAERTGNWHMHLRSFRKMLPWFFVYDHTNYARWGTIYYLDMSKLATTAPEVHYEFMQGNFVVKRLEGNFNQLSVDQALEHINKQSKDAGGIVGLTKNSTRLDEWFLSYNDIGIMIESFTSSLHMNSDAVTQNIEAGPKRIQVDEISVLKIQNEFTRFNVFTRNEDCLLSISTNEMASSEVKTALLTAQEKGEQLLQTFVALIGCNDFYKPLKKINLPTFKQCRMPRNIQVTTQKASQQGQDYLQKVLIAKEMGRDIQYQEIMAYELTPYPMALAPTGILNTPTNKSALGHIVESYTKSYKELPPSPRKLVHIIDGMSLVQAIGKPTNAKTFGDYADILNTIVFKNPFNAGRVDVVMDHYHEMSIKDCTRTKRALRKNTVNRIIDNCCTILPQQWHLFIHSVFNKQQLTDFLSRQFYEFSKDSSLKFVTSGGFRDVRDYKANYPLNTDLLVSTHEEADTRIMLHILSAKLEGYSRCVIDCKDTDVLILLAYFKDRLTDDIWVKVGTTNNVRFIAVHELQIAPHLLKNLPAFHAITGCDCTSQFVGLGKTTCWKLYLLYHDLLSTVGALKFNGDIFKYMLQFVLKLYTTSDTSCINHLRSIMASSKPINKLPPTEDSLYQHCLRVNYQTYIWTNSLHPMPSLADPLENGWERVQNALVPILTTKPAIPSNSSILATCNCKKGCSRFKCSCTKNSLYCIGSCKCMGQISTCQNSYTKNQKHNVCNTPEDISEMELESD